MSRAEGRAASSADVVVIGAGVMGTWTALAAARSGRSTLLLDALSPGDRRASSAGETRIIRTAHGADRHYAAWSRTALDGWRRLEAASGERLFVPTGVLWLGRRGGDFERSSAETLGSLAVPHERLAAAEVRHRWPMLAVGDDEGGLFEPEAGLLRARRGVLVAVRAMVDAGGRVARGDVRPGRSAARRLIDVVATGGERHAGGVFVFACGPWLPGLFPRELGGRIRVTRQDVVFLRPPLGDRSFRPGALPAWVDWDAAMYGTPALDGHGAKVASDAYGPAFDPSSGRRLVDPRSIARARRYAARRLPGLSEAPVAGSRVCQYASTTDAHFVIDRHPGYDNVWLVGGGSGHAYKHGPVIGERVVARLDGSPPAPDEARFRLDREAIVGSGYRPGAEAGAAAAEPAPAGADAAEGAGA